MTWLLKLFPGKMWIYAVVLASTFAAGGTAAWTFQSMRYDAKETARAKQELIDVELAAKETFRKQDAVITAQNAARTRETGIRIALDTARASASGLRSDLAAAMQAAGTNLQACTALNIAQAEISAECADRYTTVAAEADAWASDAQTLDEAWAK